jgi:hypothetical protein
MRGWPAHFRSGGFTSTGNLVGDALIPGSRVITSALISSAVPTMNREAESTRKRSVEACPKRGRQRERQQLNFGALKGMANPSAPLSQACRATETGHVLNGLCQRSDINYFITSSLRYYV